MTWLAKRNMNTGNRSASQFIETDWFSKWRQIFQMTGSLVFLKGSVRLMNEKWFMSKDIITGENKGLSLITIWLLFVYWIKLKTVFFDDIFIQLVIQKLFTTFHPHSLAFSPSPSFVFGKVQGLRICAVWPCGDYNLLPEHATSSFHLGISKNDNWQLQKWKVDYSI